MLPFQYLSLRDLPGVMGWFFDCWIYFGVPSVLAMLGASYVIKRLKLGHFRVFRHVSFRSIALSLPLAGFLFGLSSGYFEAWTYQLDPRQPDPWYCVFAIPGAPGDMMANSYGGDWQDDEAWDYRGDISIWNGLFWASVATAGVLAINIVFRPMKQIRLPAVWAPL